MEKENQKEYILGQFGEEYNNLEVKCVSSYTIYCEYLEGFNNIPKSFEDWKKFKKESTYAGLYKPNENKIYINNYISNKARFKQTLRHELIHAFMDIKIPDGIDWDEEIICETFSKHHDYYVNLVKDVCDVCMKRFEEKNKLVNKGESE